MANDILTVPSTLASFTITLASLASGAGRQSDMVANSATNYPAALVFIEIQSSSSAPNANTFYNVYLLRGDNPASSTYRTDGAGASDASIAIQNAQLLGAIAVTPSASTFDAVLSV